MQRRETIKGVAMCVNNPAKQRLAHLNLASIIGDRNQGANFDIGVLIIEKSNILTVLEANDFGVNDRATWAGDVTD
jgi:hypothetical protein